MARTWNSAGTTALKVTWLAARGLGAVSSRAAGPATARLWFTPWQVPLSERARAKQERWLESTEPIAIPFEGGALAGYAAGDGPTVLLVHGWGERAGALGAFIAPLVDAGYQVVGIDLPAHGGSPGTQTDALVNAAALRAASAAVGGIEAVVAHSMGAHSTTLALAEGLPARAAVLLAPAVRLEHGLDKFGDMFRLPARAVRGLRATIEKRYGRTIWEDLAADHLARRIQIPALILHDRDDPQVDLADARLLASAWEESSVRVTEGLGHNKVVRDPGVVSAAVGFLDDVIGGRVAPRAAEPHAS